MSCQGKEYYGRSRGSTIHGTDGTVLIDRDGYQVFSLDDKKIDEYAVGKTSTSQDLISADSMTDDHFRNFFDAIREGQQLRAPIGEGNKSVTILQLSNIAWKVGRSLNLNKDNGHVVGDPGAMQLWQREYEKGWEPKM
jgi:hypothetical protein